MSIIEQIKVEIERLKSNMDDRDPLAPNQKAGYLFALADVLSFISTLESEKPSKELEEEIKRWWGEQYMKNSEGLPILPVVQGIARYFAKWGEHNALEHLRAARRTEEAYQEVAKEMRKQIAESGSSEIPNDLEEAAKRYSNNKHPMTPTGARESQEDFIAGAKWDREQIMKNAKDGWIDEECVIVLNDGTRIDLQPDYEKNPAFEFEYAQDVRVIILPKEN